MNNKISFSIFLGENIWKVLLSKIYDDENTIIRYIKASLSKSNIDILKLAKKEFLNDKVSKCPFCGNDSKYNISFKVDIENRTIEINGIELISNDQGWKDLHCKGGRKICQGSRLNANSFEFISKSYNISLEDAKEYLHSRNKSPFYAHNHSSAAEYKKYQSRDKNSYIERYGELIGAKKFNDFVKKMEFKGSSKYLIEKFGSDVYNSIIKKKTVCTLGFFIQKYGINIANEKFNEYKKSLGITREDFIEKYGEKKWEDIQKEKSRKKSLEYFVQILGFEEGHKRFNDLRDSYSFTKEDYILKYGEEKYLDRFNNSKNHYYSKEAKIFFSILIDKMNENQIYFSNLKWLDNEFFLWDTDYRKIYFYDFYFESNNKKIIIEYDQAFWHPEKDDSGNYKKNAFSSLNGLNKNEEDAVMYNERKKNWALFSNYDLINVLCDKVNPSRDNWKWDEILEEIISKIKNIITC